MRSKPCWIRSKQAIASNNKQTNQPTNQPTRQEHIQKHDDPIHILPTHHPGLFRVLPSVPYRQKTEFVLQVVSWLQKLSKMAFVIVVVVVDLRHCEIQATPFGQECPKKTFHPRILTNGIITNQSVVLPRFAEGSCKSSRYIHNSSTTVAVVTKTR